MAERAHITLGSLRLHLARIRKKIGAHNNQEILHVLGKTPEHAESPLRFSSRGKEVFLLILEGKTCKAIGESLGMSVSGVKRHKENMLRQNGCGTMRELIAKYREGESVVRTARWDHGEPPGGCAQEMSGVLKEE